MISSLLLIGAAYAGDVELTNSPSGCINTFVTSPLEDEIDELAAAKLTPPSYPATITSVQYTLWNGDWDQTAFCDAGIGHEVVLFVGTGPTPPSTPVSIIAQPTTEFGDAQTSVLLTADVVPPITLKTGEHLFVAIRMTADDSGVVCPGMCRTRDWKLRQNYWSNTTEAPYSWSALESFGLAFVGQNFEITATATVP